MKNEIRINTELVKALQLVGYPVIFTGNDSVYSGACFQQNEICEVVKAYETKSEGVVIEVYGLFSKVPQLLRVNEVRTLNN